MTILVLTNPSDLTADLVIQAIGTRVPIARVDLADFPADLALTATHASGGWSGSLTTSTRAVDLETIRAVYYRRPGRPRMSPQMSDAEREWAGSEARYGLRGVLTSLPARWVDHPDAVAAAEYKPRQLVAARAAGLAVPHTLITNDPAAVKDFANGCPDGIVYKALSGSPDDPSLLHWAIYTRPIDLDSDLSGIPHTAHLVQEQLPKAYEVRLTVVGDRLFAARIDAHSDAGRQDWRSDYQHLTYRAIDVPDTAAEPIRHMMRSLGLRFGALDFVVDDHGDWTFLEVNPGGQWGWIERHTGLPIAAAIADDLIEGEHHEH